MKICSRIRIGPPLLVLILCAVAADAYEVETHQDISRNAFAASAASTYLFSKLHIDSGHDFEGPTTVPLVTVKRQLVDWVRRGAEDEDDHVTISVNPTTTRYRHHFYNPLDGTGLHFGIITGRPSPDWSIEFQSIFGQDFSFADARTYFYEALKAPHPTDREHALARTFLTLGHVIHLIQDMAQPQHTRNDPHGPGPLGGLSLYERYTERRENRARLPFDGYPPVYRDDDTTTFNFVYDFWHRPGGMGLADYSNRGFVSAGTNFRATVYTPLDFLPNPNFSKPDNAGASIEVFAIGDLLEETGLTGDVDFIATPVEDHYQDQYTGSTDTNHRTSSYSIFDPDLEHYNAVVTYRTNDGDSYQTRATFSLNRFNFEAAWQLLIPRAVGYSAGLINYFFRGRIDLVADPDSNQVFIKNDGPEDMNGTFELYYDDVDGTRRAVPTRWEQLSIRAGEQGAINPCSLPFTPPPDGTYILVFHGTMGNEAPAAGGPGAVAAKVVQLPSFLLVQSHATYQSVFFDSCCQRVGDGHREAFSGGEGFFIDRHNAFFGDGFAHSSDGGRSFEMTPPSLLPSWYGSTYGNFTYLGGSEVFAASGGGDASPPTAIGSTDCGHTWASRPAPPAYLPYWFDFMQSVGSGKIFLKTLAIDSSSSSHLSWAFQSLDGGLTWSPLSPTLDGYQLRGCQLPMTVPADACADFWWLTALTWNQVEGDASILLAAGYGGPFGEERIWKSVDSGLTWRTVLSFPDFSCGAGVTSLAIAPGGEALAVLNGCGDVDEHLYRSADGGETWDAGPVVSNEEFQSVVYVGNPRLKGAVCP